MTRSSFVATSLPITDEQIRSLRERLLRASGNQMTGDIDSCETALRDPESYPPHLRGLATFVRDAERVRCAELLHHEEHCSVCDPVNGWDVDCTCARNGAGTHDNGNVIQR